MRFVDRHGNQILSLEDWARLGKPAAEHHWVPGRSAYELAADWRCRDAAARAVELLSLRPELEGLEFVEGIAEKKTQFDDIPRGPRNHDLLVHARANAGPVVVGVEGKADEPFDRTLSRWRDLAIERSPDSQAPTRLDHLTMLFFGDTIDSDTREPALGLLGYQLLSALAGTLADAKCRSAVSAVLLIHEFRTEKTDSALHDVNAAALEDFLTRLAPGTVERRTSQHGWITEPILVRGDGKWLPEMLPISVAKLVTTVA